MTAKAGHDAPASGYKVVLSARDRGVLTKGRHVKTTLRDVWQKSVIFDPKSFAQRAIRVGVPGRRAKTPIPYWRSYENK